ncbi:MAG: hypothetical protein QXS27_08765, partial [Candidatus Jordarchaeaceae archaeon]
MLAKSNPKNVENLEFPVSIPKKLNHSDRNKHASIMVTVRIVAISFFSPGTLNYRRHNSFTHSLTVFKSPNILKGINKIVNG